MDKTILSPIVHIEVSTQAMAESLPVVYEALAHFWQDVDEQPQPFPGGVWRAAFDTALIEITTNVIRYAYPQAVISRPMRIVLLAQAGLVEAQIVDWGPPFSDAVVLQADEEADLFELPESGYGLIIVRKAVDRFEYERTTESENRWSLTKYIDSRG